MLLTDKELVKDRKVNDSLVCRDCEVVQFKTQRGSRTKTKIRALDFRRANMSLFRDLLGSVLKEGK